MYNYLKHILSTFTRQQLPNDCGRACLNSIFKYTGLDAIEDDNSNVQLSLFQLDKLAKNAGLMSSCVKMDITALNENTSPCILHILNEAGEQHFIVHYPFDQSPGFHLVGDPDRKPELISEEVLLNKWVSRAALYFKDIQPVKRFSLWFFPWNALVEFKFIPAVLWLSVPFLNILAAVLGLALSLVIQKAVEPAFINNRQSFFTLLFILLALLSLAKCLLNYLRQWLMITIGLKLDAKLSVAFYQNAYRSFKLSSRHASRFYMDSIGDVQKIHQAVALLVGVVFSDGILVMLMFGVLYYYQPALIVLQVVVFLGMFFVIDKYLPIMMIQTDLSPPSSVKAHEVAGTNLDQLEEGTNPGIFPEGYFKLSEDFSKKTRTISGLVNRINLTFDAISTFNIIVVVIVSVYNLQSNRVSYEGFLMTILLCYGMGLLMTKICNQLYTIAQGADRLRRNLQRIKTMGPVISNI